MRVADGAVKSPSLLDLGADGWDLEWLTDFLGRADGMYLCRTEPKPSGGERLIDQPNVLLMAIQEAFADLLRPLVSSPIAFDLGGLSPIDALRVHARKAFLPSADIKGFYPSVSPPRVRQALLNAGLIDTDLLELVVHAVTFKGRLPQGAPSSPIIAALTLREVDRLLDERARTLGARATRWGDNFGISGRTKPAVEELVEVTASGLEPLRLRLNEAETRIRGRHEAQILHGIAVGHGRVTILKRYRRDVEREVFRATKLGVTLEDFERIGGRISYVERLHPQEGRRLRARLKSAEVMT
jgi:hypothetical protein